MIPRREAPVDESLHDRYGSFILRHEFTATTSWFRYAFLPLLPMLIHDAINQSGIFTGVNNAYDTLSCFHEQNCSVVFLIVWRTETQILRDSDNRT